MTASSIALRTKLAELGAGACFSVENALAGRSLTSARSVMRSRFTPRSVERGQGYDTPCRVSLAEQNLYRTVFVSYVEDDAMAGRRYSPRATMLLWAAARRIWCIS